MRQSLAGNYSKAALDMAAAEARYTELPHFAEGELETGCALDPAAVRPEPDLAAAPSRSGEDTREPSDSIAEAELTDFGVKSAPKHQAQDQRSHRGVDDIAITHLHVARCMTICASVFEGISHR